MVTIRPFTGSDLDAVTRLAGQLGYPTSSEEMRQRLTHVADDQDAQLLVAAREDLEEGIVGWIHIHGGFSVQSGTFAEISGLVVDERHRDEGIGGALLRAAEAWASEHRYPTVRVRSRSTRTRTHGFYVGHDYEITKEQVMFSRDLDP